jgi:hypothetical protein
VILLLQVSRTRKSRLDRAVTRMEKLALCYPSAPDALWCARCSQVVFRAQRSTPDEYRKYAQECERIARDGSPENRETLLKIARAWRERADDAEKKIKDTPSRLLMVIRVASHLVHSCSP